GVRGRAAAAPGGRGDPGAAERGGVRALATDPPPGGGQPADRGDQPGTGRDRGPPAGHQPARAPGTVAGRSGRAVVAGGRQAATPTDIVRLIPVTGGLAFSRGVAGCPTPVRSVSLPSSGVRGDPPRARFWISVPAHVPAPRFSYWCRHNCRPRSPGEWMAERVSARSA